LIRAARPADMKKLQALAEPVASTDPAIIAKAKAVLK